LNRLHRSQKLRARVGGIHDQRFVRVAGCRNLIETGRVHAGIVDADDERIDSRIPACQARCDVGDAADIAVAIVGVSVCREHDDDLAIGMVGRVAGHGGRSRLHGGNRRRSTAR
jgi:hypothetical protein